MPVCHDPDFLVWRRALLAAPLAAAVAPWAARAQAPGNGPPPELTGVTLGGQAFSLAGLRGRVVLVMFWSTDCAVCRDKMPELRRNVAGWRDRAFEVVAVSQDRRLADLEAYERVLVQTVPASQRFVQLWAGAPGYTDTFPRRGGVLPQSYVVNAKGMVDAHFDGRIPAEAWDRIADLL